MKTFTLTTIAASLIAVSAFAQTATTVVTDPAAATDMPATQTHKMTPEEIKLRLQKRQGMRAEALAHAQEEMATRAGEHAQNGMDMAANAGPDMGAEMGGGMGAGNGAGMGGGMGAGNGAGMGGGAGGGMGGGAGGGMGGRGN